MDDTTIKLLAGRPTRGRFPVSLLVGDAVLFTGEVNPHKQSEVEAFTKAAAEKLPGMNGSAKRLEAELMQLAIEPQREPVGVTPLGERDPETGRVVLSPRRTLPTAKAFVRDHQSHPDARTIHAFADTFYGWTDNRFTPTADAALRNQLQSYLHDAARYVFDQRTQQTRLADFESNPTTVKSALDSLRDYTHLPSHLEPPFWLTSNPANPEPRDLLPFPSGTLHIPSGRVLPPSPTLFNVNAIDFDYDPDAPQPECWIEFLGQIAGDDFEWVETLQEWFGYVLTGDTSLQKMLLLVGPKRSGKGTIGRVMRRLVGKGNVAGPTTNSLAGPFGLQSLVSMSLAIVSDARFTGDGMAAVIERLLCISGEDALTIDRKFLPSVTMKMPTRFVFLTNEIPRLADASGALAGRFILLRLTQSFYGREDTTLTDRLMGELPGILLWAIEGWRRLKARGHFVQPESGVEAIDEMTELASPISAFAQDWCCTSEPLATVTTDDLYEAWVLWSKEQGTTRPTDKHVFGRDLRAALSGITTCQPRDKGEKGGRRRDYKGIRLTEAARATLSLARAKRLAEDDRRARGSNA